MLNRLLLRIKFRIQTEQFMQAELKSKIATVGIYGDDCFMIVVKNRRFERILNQNDPFGREKQGFLTGAAFCALYFLIKVFKYFRLLPPPLHKAWAEVFAAPCFWMGDKIIHGQADHISC